MKIVISNPTILMRRPIAKLAGLLEGKGHETRILCPRRLFRRQDFSLPHSCKAITYPTIKPPMNSDWPVPGPFFLFKVFKLWKESDVVIMWVPAYLSHFTISVVKKLFFPNKKLILVMDTVQGFSHSKGFVGNFLMRFYYKTFGKITFSASDKVVLYMKSMEKHALRAGIPKDKLVFIATGADSAKKKTKDVRKEFKVGKKKIVLFIGLMVPRKGVDLLLETASKFKETIFIVVGDGPKKVYYERMASSLNLKNVVFTGFRKDVQNFYSAADVFFFPSRGEGLPGVVMEAMSYGVPVVASDLPGCKELLGDSGVVCELDVNSFEKEIRELLGSKERRNALASNAKKRVKNYSWGSVVEKYEELFDGKPV